MFFNVQVLKDGYLLDDVEVLIFSSLIDIVNIFSEMAHIHTYLFKCEIAIYNYVRASKVSKRKSNHTD